MQSIWTAWVYLDRFSLISSISGFLCWNQLNQPTNASLKDVKIPHVHYLRILSCLLNTVAIRLLLYQSNIVYKILLVKFYYYFQPKINSTMSWIFHSNKIKILSYCFWIKGLKEMLAALTKWSISMVLLLIRSGILSIWHQY